MTTFPLLSLLAATYGARAYDTGNYNGAEATTTTSGGGGLTNAGVMLGLIVGIAALLLLAAMFVRVWRRADRRRAGVQTSAGEEVPSQ